MMIFIVFIWYSQVRAQTALTVTGWVDANRDGVNDLFTDADGDGRNDVNGLPFPLSFNFTDDNHDGINDLWKDRDGDGVNDYLGSVLKSMTQWADRDGDGIMDAVQGNLRGKALMQHVLDSDLDGKNDITGLPYNGRDIFGYRYGNVDEESNRFDSEYTDKNGDGMNDRFLTPDRQKALEQGRMDHFNDVDGDGIADDRGFGRLRSSGSRRGRK